MPTMHRATHSKLHALEFASGLPLRFAWRFAPCLCRHRILIAAIHLGNLSLKRDAAPLFRRDFTRGESVLRVAN